MKEYADNREFLADLTEWAKTAIGQKSDTARQDMSRNVREAFLDLWERAKLSARRDVFLPFLYVSLSAELDFGEAMLLAAACGCRINFENEERGQEEALSFHVWKKFWSKVPKFPGTELFYRASPLLFTRREERGGLCLSVVPAVFWFLTEGILPGQGATGLRWYCQRTEALPYLGKEIRHYLQMERCIREVPGKKLFYLHGSKGSGRKLNYGYLAADMGRGLAVVNAANLHSVRQFSEMRLECMLYHGLLAVELPETEEWTEEAGNTGRPEETFFLPFLLEELQEEENVFFLGVQPELPLGIGGRQYLSFEITDQAVLQEEEIYRCLTREYQWERQETAEDFLQRYSFLPGKMREILELARAYGLSGGNPCISEQNLKRAVLYSGRRSLGRYAKKIQNVYTMEDLILPLAQKEKLFHIVERVRNRKRVYEEWGFSVKSAYGNGVSMIFAGPPGTGKTMAAQAVAFELHMELYRVELPAIVDKYIGEMEKKLNHIFEEAEKSTSILFFDEADVLFSKRTEIKESNDKYSNMEIAFLLQKMEEYEGVSILATNYLQNFDEAFRRRIHDIVEFPLPDAPLREDMWKSMIPEGLPLAEELDYAYLARQFPVTGSVIKNALIYGSFLAAESKEGKLTMELILRGITHELEKSGKKLNREDYGEYYECLKEKRTYVSDHVERGRAENAKMGKRTGNFS